MPPKQEDLPWDFTNEELASIASDELHAHRPNRWTGAKSSWRELTRLDREIWDAVKHERAEDLSIHLYNAHALKRDANATKARIQDINTERFIPRKHWTAWPLHPKIVPRNTLFKKTLDKYERYTMRKPQKGVDSRDALTDEYSAVVLRLAHENFKKQLARRARKRAAGNGKDPEIRQSVEDTGEITYIEDDDGEMQLAESSAAGSSRPPLQTREKPYVPTFSADDEASYKSLRPAARQFLSELDTTFDILHQKLPIIRSWKRRAAWERRRKSSRSRGRPRVAPNTLAAGRQAKGNAKGRGRPKNVHLPLEGETRHEMLVRIARQSHRRIPYTEEEKRAAAIDLTGAAAESEHPQPEPESIGDDSEGNESEVDEMDHDADMEPSEADDMDPSEEEGDVYEAESGADRDANLSSDTSEDGDESDSQPSKAERSESTNAKNESRSKSRNLNRRFQQLVLRDWRDVLDAASRAGFPPSVLRRTADRCATLFNESTTLTLREDEEGIARSGDLQILQPGQPTKTTFHQPSSHFAEEPEPSSSSEEERAEALRMEQMPNRHSGTPSSGERSSSRGRSTSRASRASSELPGRSSRSRSASSTNKYYCPVQTCPRSLRPFDRKTNFRRHLSKVHPGVDPEVTEQDSEDEIHDGVHVDGFLKRVKIRRYRGRDLAKRRFKIDNPLQSNRSSPRKRRASTDEDYE